MRLPKSIGVIAAAVLIAACAPVATPEENAGSSSSLNMQSSANMQIRESQETTPEAIESSSAANLREVDPAVSARAKCEAGCRDQYGGSGNAGFDACIRACGAGVLRTTSCEEPGPACPSPQTPVCHGGRWYCREHPPGGAKTADDELNYPTEQLREACGEPGLACESPSIPDCRNGKWGCVGPATPVR